MSTCRAIVNAVSALIPSGGMKSMVLVQMSLEIIWSGKNFSTKITLQNLSKRVIWNSAFQSSTVDQE